MIIAASCDSHLSVSAGGVQEALWPSAWLPFSMQGWLWPVRIEWGRTEERGVKGRVRTKGEWRILSLIAGGDILQLSDKLSSLSQMNSVGKNDYPNKEMSSTSLAVQTLYLIQLYMILTSGPELFISLLISKRDSDIHYQLSNILLYIMHLHYYVLCLL